MVFHGSRIKGDRTTELSKKYPDSYGGNEGSKAARVAKDLKSHAKSRDIKWNLTPLQAFEYCLKPCHYCNFTPDFPKIRNGIDRIDNNKGYEVDNCVTCCWTCNSAKLTNSLEYFTTWVINIYNNFILKNNDIDGYVSNLIEKINTKCELEKPNIKILHHIRTELGNKYPRDYGKFSREKEQGCSYAAFVIGMIKNKAKRRRSGKGIEWNLDDVYAFELILNNCFYCGKICDWPNKRNGIDRVDNDIGYEKYNCVPCCFECNASKNNLTMDEFRNWIIRLYNNLILGNKEEINNE